VYGNHRHFRDQVPGCITLAQQFKRNGYHTEGMGKIFHGAFAGAYVGTLMHDPASWSEPFHLFGPRYYFTPEGIAVARRVYAEQASRNGAPLDNWVNDFVRGLATEAPDIADEVPYDGQLARRAVERLRNLKELDRPFFLAVGFLKPHLPFIAPKRYWNLYDRSEIELEQNCFAPRGGPPIAMTNWSELRYYHDIPDQGPLEDAKARELVHGYYACVSYVDTLIGRLLAELDRLDLTERTIVIVWGDHGWQFGSNGIWGKATNFEKSTRAPLIIAGPGIEAKGRQCQALVEFVDIYPSLCDLAGLAQPKQLEGISFVPLLSRTERPWKKAAFSQYRRSGNIMGYTMRTDSHRFTLWQNREEPTKVHAVELYDHRSDPLENENLAGHPAHSSLVQELTTQLRAGWRAALPQ
jgi:arylsulfatase A-like enzyme